MTMLLIAALAACSQSGSGDTPAPGVTPSAGDSRTATGGDEGRVPDATLENTYWELTGIGGRPALVTDNIAEPHLLLHPADRRAGGSTGCNRFSGSYEVSGESLRFGQLISTLRACVDPEMNRQERAFLGALNAARAWKVTGDTLVLSGDTGPVARFTATYLR